MSLLANQYSGALNPFIYLPVAQNSPEFWLLTSELFFDQEHIEIHLQF
jgi:hypothetical protein